MKSEYQKNILTASRCTYLGLAALWWVLNKQHIILSEWDANRINVPMLLYLVIPILALALYVIRPTSSIWAVVITVFTLGYGLHVYKSLQFDINHMGVKTDISTTATQIILYLIIFAVCVAVLFMSGPYVRNKYGTARKI